MTDLTDFSHRQTLKTIRPRLVLARALGFLATALDPGLVYSQDAASLLSATGIEAGLAVHIGCGNGSLTVGLDNQGKILVHGLAQDDASLQAARKTISEAGKYGLVSVEKPLSLTTLPYATNLINLVVADLDALGNKAPSREEILRVLAPNGVAYLKNMGSWNKTAKPRPAEMDEWTHDDYGPDGNAVSHDKIVKPSTSLQWMAWYRRDACEGLYGPVSTGLRASQGRVFFQLRKGTKGARQCGDISDYLDARDAFNGVSLWLKPGPGSRQNPMVADNGKLYFTAKSGEPLRALDAKTGEPMRDYTDGGRLSNNALSMQVLSVDGSLIQTATENLFILDAATGKVKGKYTEAGKFLYFPTYDAARKRVYAVVGTKLIGVSRWSSVPIEAVICLDARTGNLLWRNTEFVGKGTGLVQFPTVGQLIYQADHLVLFGSNGFNGDPYLGAIDVVANKLLWGHGYQVDRGLTAYDIDGFVASKSYWKLAEPDLDKPTFGYNAMVRNGVIHLSYGGGYKSRGGYLTEWDLKTGNLIKHNPISIPNQRCARATATDNYLLNGFQTFNKWDTREFAYQQITRSTCATPGFPANGLMYYGPNTMCGCFVMMRNYSAYSSDPVAPPLDDSQRLQSGKAASAKAFSGTAPAPGLTFDSRQPVLTTKPVRDDWNNTDNLPYPETAPISLGSKTYAAVVNEHQLECRGSDGKPVWSFTAGGRISRAPVLAGGLVFFGSHDGWVYALHENDGSLAWRFLAARNERKIVAFSQVESAWPVFGVILNEGKLCFAAGHHPELDGGIQVWGLEPADGKVAWKGLLSKTLAWRQPGDRSEGRTKNSYINDVLSNETGALKLQSLTIDPKNPNTVATRRLTEKVGSALRNGDEPLLAQAAGGLNIDLGSTEAAILTFYDYAGKSMGEFQAPMGGVLMIPEEQLARGRMTVLIRRGSRTFTAQVRVK